MVPRRPGRDRDPRVIDGGLSAIFRARLPEAHWQSVETAGTGRGVPDLNYCLRGAEGWIENKRVKGWRIPSLRPEQVAWAEQRIRAGGRVFLAARKGGSLWLWHGSAARALIDGGDVRRVPHLVFALGGPARWPWVSISAVLRSPAAAPKRIFKEG